MNAILRRVREFLENRSQQSSQSLTRNTCQLYYDKCKNRSSRSPHGKSIRPNEISRKQQHKNFPITSKVLLCGLWSRYSYTIREVDD